MLTRCVGLLILDVQVQKHKTRKDCWMAIDGLVYDVTAFLSVHPGGDEVMLEVGGECLKLYQPAYLESLDKVDFSFV